MAQTHQILIECPKSDLSFFEKLKEENNEVTIVPTSNLQGSLEVIEVIVSLTSAIIPLITTFLTEKPKNNGKRKVIIDGEKKVFENYDPDDVTQILKDLNE